MKKIRIFIIAGLIILVGLIFPVLTIEPARNLFFKILKPFAIVSNYSVDKVSIFFRNLANLGSLAGQNQKLIKENLELQSQLAILKEAQHENEILKKEMGFLSTKGDINLMPASIIGRSLTGYLKTIVIDKGANDNIKAGQAVVSQGFLVGTVGSVLKDSCEVVLITDYNSLVPVVLQESRGTGLLRGGLGGLTIEDIPLNIPINRDEQVITSGLGGDIPSGIIIGNVEEVISKEGEIFQKATVRSPIKLYFLEFVFIVQ